MYELEQQNVPVRLSIRWLKTWHFQNKITYSLRVDRTFLKAYTCVIILVGQIPSSNSTGITHSTNTVDSC